MLNLLPYVQGHSSFMIIKNDLNKTLFLHLKQNMYLVNMFKYFTFQQIFISYL